MFKCSTPCGIKDFCTRRKTPLARFFRPVLNALRHQRFLHFLRCQRFVGFALVLNALRHRRFLHLGIRIRNLDGLPCVLNAFRHQRFLHRKATGIPLLDDRCSTPFGTKDFCTAPGRCRAREPDVLNAFRHQRFLHSVRSEPDSTGYSVCSTPFGIKDFCTQPPPAALSRVESAQRLSASKISAPRTRRRCRTRWRRVLNAFRHQRFLHASAAPDRFGELLVLNAFRHQRFLHLAGIAERRRAILCSTPFGIKDFCTPSRFVRMISCVCAQRLSASKISAQVPIVTVFVDYECSTPFGIKDFCTKPGSYALGEVHEVLNAFRHQRFLHIVNVAVIEIWRIVLNAFRHQRFLHTRLWRCSEPGRREVLNAFRHQRFLHSRQNQPRILPPGCAQRLSASKISARTATRADEDRVY